MSRSWSRAGAALGRGFAAARARPRHVVLGSLVAGLVAGPMAPPLALAAGAAGAVAAGRAGPALAAAAAAMGGAWVAERRAPPPGPGPLGPLLGRSRAARAELLEAPRPRRYGRAALARITAGPGAGARVVISARRGARWPREPVGAEVAARGSLRRLRPWEGWLARRGARAALAAQELRPTGRRRGGVAGALDAGRVRAERALTADLPGREGALLRGMVLGQDEALASAVRDDFRASGLSHIVAASGQNVALLGALAVPLLAAVGLGLHARLLVLLGLIAAYVGLAGGGPSIQRAGVMGAVAILATLAGRPAARWYALMLAAAVTLTLSPAAASDPGWQLSFAAVAAILALEPRLASALQGRRFAPPFAHAVAMTLAATLGTAPLLSLHFGRLSLVSLPVNVVAAPVVAAAMWIGMGAAAIGQLDGAAGALVALPAAPLLAFLEWLARTAARLPKANLGLHLGPAPTVGVYAGVLAVTALPRLRRPALGAAVVGVVAALAWPPTGAPALPPGDTRVSFLAVGQGDATLIQAGEHAVLVDAGPLDGPVLARLANAGVRRLDLAVVTHAQADHEGGMAAVLGRYPVDLLIDGGDGARTLEHRSVLRVAAAHGVRRLVPDAGQAVRAGPLELDVLWPRAEPAALHAGADPNQRAIVARLRSGSFDLLLTADAESDVTAPLAVGPVEALKVAHHGSADPGLPDLLRRLRPAVAVIEVGRHNPYGHPALPTVAELAAAVPRVYRTDRDGTVTLDIRGGRMTVRTEDG